MGNRTKNRAEKPNELTIGGQAVIEGVMMRSTSKYAIAVRKPDGKIKIKSVNEKKRNGKFRKLPFVRGVIGLFDTLVLGIKALNYSAEEADPEPKQKAATGTAAIIITMGISLVLALLIFKFLPLVIASWVQSHFGGNNLAFNLVDGLTKIIILVIYLSSIGLMTDVKRLFQYHGAEHKAVSCYEKGKPLTIENMKKQSTAHPRCGTSFIMFVMLISMVFYMLIPLSLGFWSKFMLRLMFLPVIAGVSYEVIRLAGRHPKNSVVRILIWPSMQLQKLSTREPDDKQLEVAAKALKSAL